MIGSGFRSQEVDMYQNDGDDEMRENFSAGGIEQQVEIAGTEVS